MLMVNAVTNTSKTTKMIKGDHIIQQHIELVDVMVANIIYKQ